MSLIVVVAIRGRCARFMILTATVSHIFGGQTNSSILDVSFSYWRYYESLSTVSKTSIYVIENTITCSSRYSLDGRFEHV